MSIYVEGTLAHADGTVSVTVTGRERIAAVLAAARRSLSPTDETVLALVAAVERDDDSAELPDIWDQHDAAVVADVLDDVRNGDDRSGVRAATRLRKLPGRMVVCPTCGGEGECEAS
jgi:hypothetical protein